MLNVLRLLVFFLRIFLQTISRTLLQLELKAYVAFGIFFTFCFYYAINKFLFLFAPTYLRPIVIMLRLLLDMLIALTINYGVMVIFMAATMYCVALLVSWAQSYYLRLALANIRAYSQFFEVRASQQVRDYCHYLHQLAESYQIIRKNPGYSDDLFFQKIISLGRGHKTDVEAFVQTNFMANPIFEENLTDAIPVIDMLDSPLEQNCQPINLELFHHTQRVYSIVDRDFDGEARYTAQFVTKDILQNEIAAREMAILFGLEDLIPPFAVYSAPEGVSAYGDHNEMPRRMERVSLNPNALLTVEQINILPERPQASFVLLRRLESDTNIKELVYQANFVEQVPVDQREEAIRRLNLLDVSKTQKLIILQYILGLRADLNDITLVEQDDGALKSLYHSQMMPDNNYACSGTHLMNNSALLPQSTRDWHPVSQIFSENMRSLQLPALALPKAASVFTPQVKRVRGSLSELMLFNYHQAKKLFSAQSVCAQYHRFKIVQKALMSQATSRDLLRVFQEFDIAFEFNIENNAEVAAASNLSYTHLSKCPITPYSETQFIFAQWAFDAGVKRQKNQYQRLLCFDGRSPAQCEKLLDNYYHKEIRDALRRASA